MTSKKILLVIEDDASLRNILHDGLEAEGFAVLEAEDGQKGLKTALSERPDLILLDILMPEMDGLTVMKELRKANVWGKTVPIILITNVSPDNEKINSAIAENEPAYYLVKSNISISSVIEKIKERLSIKI